MALEKLKRKGTISDEEFDSIFPEEVREHSNRHYSSVFISQKAAEYLAEGDNMHILDIGSGTGKFCLVGASCTDAHFTGIEYRKYQSDIARECADRYAITNASFVNANILDLDFGAFDAFYIFNPFLENIDPSARMDQLVNAKKDDYEVFRSYVYDQLNNKKIGTRLATYWTNQNQVPYSYEMKKSMFGDTLKFWEKVL